MQIDWKGLGTVSNKCSVYIVADVLVEEGGLGEKSSLFNPKINQWLIWESTPKSTKKSSKDSPLPSFHDDEQNLWKISTNAYGNYWGDEI
jgi:hypothetical protein